MTVHRTTHPRAWATAAAAAFIAGLARSGVTAAAPAVSTGTAKAADATRSTTGTCLTDVIALRPDPADPSRLVVDFGAAGSGPALDAGTSAASRFSPRGGDDEDVQPSDALVDERITAEGHGGDTVETGHGPAIIDAGQDRIRRNPRRGGAVHTVAVYRRLGPSWV